MHLTPGDYSVVIASGFLLILPHFFPLKQFNSKTRDGFTVNSKVPSLKDPGKEYDGFTITITGDRLVFADCIRSSTNPVISQMHFFPFMVSAVVTSSRACELTPSTCVCGRQGGKHALLHRLPDHGGPYSAVPVRDRVTL